MSQSRPGNTPATETAAPARRVWCAVLAGVGVAAAAWGEPGNFEWRMNGSGRYPDASPVTAWGPGTNVIWATPMSNWGNASPVLAGDRIFVCSEPDELLCVAMADGAVLWRRSVKLSDTWTDEDLRLSEERLKQMDELKKEYDRLDDALAASTQAKTKDPAKTNQALRVKHKALEAAQGKVMEEIGQMARWAPPKTDPTNGYTSATPVSDGRHVWVLMGTGVAACFDLSGERRWVRFVEGTSHASGHSASPVLCEGKLLIHVNSLRAYDPLTGELIWENTGVPRSWGTPFPTRVGETAVVVTAKGKVVRVSDGRILGPDAGELQFGSPVVADGIAYFIEAGGQAARLGPSTNGTVTVEKVWTTQPKKANYYASAAWHDGLLYVIHQKNWFSAIDAGTGKIVKGEKIRLGEGDAYTSVTLAGGLLFVGHESGRMAVIRPGRDFTVLAVNTLDKFRSTPVFEGGRMYLRTSKFLYCIGTTRQDGP